jgi:ribosomal protein S6
MPQANPNLILMNFKLPKELKSEFQSECKARKAFMTSVLIYLMKDYLNQKSTNENQ